MAITHTPRHRIPATGAITCHDTQPGRSAGQVGGGLGQNESGLDGQVAIGGRGHLLFRGSDRAFRERSREL